MNRFVSLTSNIGLMKTTIALGSWRWHQLRGYAVGHGRSRLGKTLSLDQFLQRSRVLSLYRTVIRETRKIQDPTTRHETRAFARQEIERYRDVDDIQQIRFLVSSGKKQLDSIERFIGGV